jgi:hypothetical protein
MKKSTTLVICPGIHEPQLTDRFLRVLKARKIIFAPPLIFPTQKYPAFSGFHILQFLQQELPEANKNALVFLSFSAGVVGAIAAALAWQANGGQIIAFIALDGWGVPLFSNFPIHRLSHDEFTHWSSALLGSGGDSFYADPPVEHLDLWRSPDLVTGWAIAKNANGKETRTAIAQTEFLSKLLQQYLGGFCPNVSG